MDGPAAAARSEHQPAVRSALVSRRSSRRRLPPPSPRARFSLLRRRALSRGRCQLGLQRPANQLRRCTGAEPWSQRGVASSPRVRCGQLLFPHVEISVIFRSRDVGDERSALGGVYPSEDLSRACPRSHAVPRPSGLGTLQHRTLSRPAGPKPARHFSPLGIETQSRPEVVSRLRACAAGILGQAIPAPFASSPVLRCSFPSARTDQT